MAIKEYFLFPFKRGAYLLAEFLEVGRDVATEEVYKAGEEVDVDDDLMVVFTSVRP